MNRIIGTLKIGIGATVSMLIASLLGLQYMASAGIITILSIQSTKKESIKIAVRRIIAALIALSLGSILFIILGNKIIVFGLYVIVFVPIAKKLEVTEGIVPASVLVTHLLGETNITLSILVNEILLLTVGVGVALLVNLYMPSIETELVKDMRQIERDMQSFLEEMALVIEQKMSSINKEEKLKKIEEEIALGKRRASYNANNYLFTKPSYYEKYFKMRALQFEVIKYMLGHVEKLSSACKETYIIAELIRALAACTKGEILVETLQENVNKLREEFRQSHLPGTRVEFENRAMLYQILNDVEQFLMAKRYFKEQLTVRECHDYMEHYSKNNAFDNTKCK